MGCSGRGMGEVELGFEEVDVVTPTQKMLARKLTLRLKKGHSLLVTGGGGWDVGWERWGKESVGVLHKGNREGIWNG